MACSLLGLALASHVYLPIEEEPDVALLAAPADPAVPGEAEAEEELEILAGLDGDELSASEPAGDDGAPVDDDVAPVAPVAWTFRASTSAYAWGCGASGRTASGEMPRWGHVAACCPNGRGAGHIPFGTELEIEGLGRFTVADRGSAVGPGKLDIFWPQGCDSARQYGRQPRAVRVLA